MPDISFLMQYVNIAIFGICLCVGYAIKTAFDKIDNKYIPLFALILGCVLSVLVNLHSGITLEVILGGMASGLASTGAYELLRNLLNKANTNPTSNKDSTDTPQQ
jgi:Na+/glutamate symporter